jgi:ABC-type molybdenum transport system ATPase subunit/photorepair protein PhrA
MFFTVLPSGTSPPSSARSKAFLITDNWDDWFEFSTMYTLVYIDEQGEHHNIGSLKIGEFDMPKGQRRANIPDRFNALNKQFFSLGQDDSYYKDLNELGAQIRNRVLRGLQDLATNLNVFERALKERVTGISLLRSVAPATVRGQFQRLAAGGARLSRYEFSYSAPRSSKKGPPPVTLSFQVEPESQPPTNIHVLIGRNGVGKTYLLNLMTRALVEESAPASEVGLFTAKEGTAPSDLFANIVSVTFSAFDPFQPLPVRRDKSSGVQYFYIGLKRSGTTEDGKQLAPKSPSRLSGEFTESVQICRKGARSARWRRALETLEADPIFKDAEVAVLADESDDDEELRAKTSSLFNKLSSGHKIVLLTITRLVECVAERTLVLLDEPEAHLHPPLLSAFVRALSDLLVNRNGVAIVATHSPVVLQEVPKSCAWKIRRTGIEVKVERPEIETFGENVGILTREVFGLEVTHSGFHKLIRESIDQNSSFEAVLESFGGELGAEAKALVRALIAARTSDDLL